MSSRMEKYYDKDTHEFIGSRTKKNETLYQEISHDELDNINITSNAQVIGESEKNIDINKIKELLEKKYSDEPKKKAPVMKTEILDADIDSLEEVEETKEYNINSILKRAKLDKNVDYERERLKKIRDTQYDILKGLDLEEEEDAHHPVKVSSNEKDLLNLINTITEKELTREMNPLDILTDLKGSDHTEVLEGVREELEKKDIQDTVKKEVKKEIDKTFYTNSMSFTKSDFDDFNDLKEDLESNKILIRVLLVIVVIAVLIGVVFLVNHLFSLNWF